VPQGSNPTGSTAIVRSDDARGHRDPTARVSTRRGASPGRGAGSAWLPDLVIRAPAGERVATWAPGLPERVIFEFAEALDGLTLVTVNPTHRRAELPVRGHRHRHRVRGLAGAVRAAGHRSRVGGGARGR
jgi:hypothetical protein